MMRCRGGQKVHKGDYWNFATGERVHVDEETVLPGESRVKYIKMHPAGVLLAGPVLGIVYAVFLPLLGITMLFFIVWKKVFGLLLAQVGRVAGVRWIPNVAYLSGRKERRKKEPPSENESEEQ